MLVLHYPQQQDSSPKWWPKMFNIFFLLHFFLDASLYTQPSYFCTLVSQISDFPVKVCALDCILGFTYNFLYKYENKKFMSAGQWAAILALHVDLHLFIILFTISGSFPAPYGPYWHHQKTHAVGTTCILSCLQAPCSCQSVILQNVIHCFTLQLL